MPDPGVDVTTEALAALDARGVEGAQTSVEFDETLGDHGVWTLALTVPNTDEETLDGWGVSRQYVRTSDTDNPTREALDLIAYEMTSHIEQGATQ